MGRRSYTIADVKKTIETEHPGSRLISREYTGCKSRIEIVCEDGHEFVTNYDNIKKGHWCGKCAPKKHQQTCLKNSGYRFAMQNPKTKEKLKQNCIESYGCEHPLQIPAIREKIKRTLLEKTGYEYALLNPETKEKAKQSLINRTGYDHNMKNPETREKAAQSNLKKLGVRNPFQSKEIIEKSKQTRLQKTGYEYPAQNPDTREKQKQTNLKNNGYEYPAQNPQCQGKRIKTNVERYGCPHPSQNSEVHEKQTKSNHITTIKYHWLTGQQLKCTASYEGAVVDYLNNNKINYIWQPKPPFVLSNDKRYFIDLYIIDMDMWVEIKGYMRPHSLLKWTEFHETIHQNSELWDKKKLEEMQILRKSPTRIVLDTSHSIE